MHERISNRNSEPERFTCSNGPLHLRQKCPAIVLRARPIVLEGALASDSLPLLFASCLQVRAQCPIIALSYSIQADDGCRRFQT